VTDIEKALLARTFQSALHDYSESWSDIVEVNPQIDTVTSTMLFTQVATPGDMVMVASFEFKLSSALGMISICVPVTVLEPVMANLSTEQCLAGARRSRHDRFGEEVSQSLSRVPVECSAVLGTASVTVRDLLNLSEGDVVRLDNGPQNELMFAVGDHSKFYCRPGLVGNKLAVQITRVDQDAAGSEAA
jgi:flagellar motor switch protein FliM